MLLDQDNYSEKQIDQLHNHVEHILHQVLYKHYSPVREVSAEKTKFIQNQITEKQLTFSFSVPSTFLSSRFDNLPGATVIGKVVEKTKILPVQLAPYDENTIE